MLLGVFLCGCHSASAPHPSWPAIHLASDDRILVLAPHPDDEVLGCGGVIQDAVAMGLPLRVVFLTYGDNNQWSFLVYRKHPVFIPAAVRQMGLVRHDEAVAADRVLGLSPDQLTFLGYPDFGTLRIWEAHWRDRPPFRSMLTHVTEVPYPNARRRGASYAGEEVLKDLTEIVREFRPTKVFVSHPGDHMPDHAALYLFTRVALWDLEPALRPEVYPYLVHFRGWPRPRGFQPTEDLSPPSSLIRAIAWRENRLSPQELERGQVAIRAHRTQYGSSARYLLSFVRPNELFGYFPSIALRRTTSPTPLSSSANDRAGDAHEELTDEERAKFVGLEERRVWLEGEQLIVSVSYSRPLAEAVELSIFVFGYRPDRPFGVMPKLHLKLGALSHQVLDQHRLLAESGVTVTRRPTHVTVHIPLESLGNPQRILTSARTYLGEVPLDWGAWRIVEVALDANGPRR